MILTENSVLRLRNLEPSDLNFFMELENSSEFWTVCDTRVPFSRFVLEKILECKTSDFYSEKQLRLVIELKQDKKAIGFVDFFDFFPLHRRASIGIIIFPKGQQNKGYGKKALSLAINYGFSAFNLHQIFAELSIENIASVKLFEASSFTLCGQKKDWLLVKNKWQTVASYQLINEDEKTK